MRRLKWIIIIGQLMLAASLKAGDLDLTELNVNQVRDRLETVLPQLTAGLEAPAILFSRPTKPAVLLSARYNIPDMTGFLNEFPVLPTFGIAVGVTPTITLAGQLGSGRWQGQSLNSMSVFLGYFWRNPDQPDQIICGINHTKGLADFHFRDVSIGYSKQLQGQRWELSLTGALHFIQADVHITDCIDSGDNYKTSKKIEFGQASVEIYRNLGEYLKIGPTLTFSAKSFSGGFTIGGHF